jgi:hypothetical protein
MKLSGRKIDWLSRNGERLGKWTGKRTPRKIMEQNLPLRHLFAMMFQNKGNQILQNGRWKFNKK